MHCINPFALNEEINVNAKDQRNCIHVGQDADPTTRATVRADLRNLDLYSGGAGRHKG